MESIMAETDTCSKCQGTRYMMGTRPFTDFNGHIEFRELVVPCPVCNQEEHAKHKKFEYIMLIVNVVVAILTITAIIYISLLVE